MKSDILVIGALGNVGREVTRCLIDRGITPRAADLSIEKVQQRFGDRVEAAAFDFLRPETFSAAFQGIQKLFLVRPPQISNVRRDLLPALEAAKQAGVRQVVFLSLIGIEQNKMAPHYKVEQWLRSSGLDYTFLRCSFFMQNLNTTHCAEIRDRSEIFIPVGQARTSFVDVRDIGAVAALALTQPGHAKQAYDLTGAEALDYDQVAAIFSQVLQRQVVYRDPAALHFFIRQWRLKSNLMYALITTWLYGNTRNGMADQVTGEVERLLGRKPVSMRQFIEDYQDDWKPRYPPQ